MGGEESVEMWKLSCRMLLELDILNIIFASCTTSVPENVKITWRISKLLFLHSVLLVCCKM